MKKLIIITLAVISIGTVAIFASAFLGFGLFKANTNFSISHEINTNLSTHYEKQGVYVELTSENNDYPANIGTISYKIVNSTGQSVDVVLIPKLERNLGSQFEDKWEQIEFSDGVGFCGTADSIESEWSGDIDMNWFSGLSAGKYRLTFGSYDGTFIEPAEFVLSDEKSTFD